MDTTEEQDKVSTEYHELRIAIDSFKQMMYSPSMATILNLSEKTLESMEARYAVLHRKVHAIIDLTQTPQDKIKYFDVVDTMEGINT